MNRAFYLLRLQNNDAMHHRRLGWFTISHCCCWFLWPSPYP